MTDFVHAFNGDTKISVQGIREIKTAATTNLGSVKPLGQGREVVYAKLSTAAHSSAMVAGAVMIAPAALANHMQRAAAQTASIGARSVFLVIGATSAVKDQYAGGLLHISSGAGSGYSYMIDGHQAWAASATAAKVLLKDGLEVALTTASICNLIPNLYRDVVISTNCAAKTAIPVGVLLKSAALTNGGYTYLGKKGVWPAAIEGTELTGMQLVLGSAPGTLTVMNTATLTFSICGKCVVTGQATALVNFDL